MTPPSDASIEAALSAMRTRYVETSRGFIATLHLIAAQLVNTPASEDLLMSLRRELHRVSGTAGSLGFHEVGRMSSAMETLVRRWREEPTVDRDRRSAVVLGFSRTIAQAFADTVTPAAVGGTRYLLLLGIPARAAERLVAEGALRGLAVERVDESASLASLKRTSPVWGLVAMEAVSGREVAQEARATVLLRDASDGAGFRRAPTGTVVDSATEPGEIIELLERTAARQGTSPGTILLVDDDPMILVMERAAAEQDGLVVETAASGAEFREALTRLVPTVIVLDIVVPDANGIDLLREVRGSRTHRDVPVLMLSGRSDVQTRELAFAAGADDYMVKPIVPSEFQWRVQKLLELGRERRTSTGLDPASGLPLAARTMQDLETVLRTRGVAEWSVAIIRPSDGETATFDRDPWQGECVRLGRVAREAGGMAGLVDDVALAMALPAAPLDAASMLASAAAARIDPVPSWCAGVVGTGALPLATPAALLSAAGDAFLAARELGATVRLWTESDTAFAPDVIIIEDDASLRELLEFALGARGLTHRSYATGPDGLAALLSLRVVGRTPIVLLDVDLPGMDGHSLHERLRLERPDTYHVVFLSQHSGESDQLRAIHGGALDYLVKPVSLRVLMAKLGVWRERTRPG